MTSGLYFASNRLPMFAVSDNIISEVTDFLFDASLFDSAIFFPANNTGYIEATFGMDALASDLIWASHLFRSKAIGYNPMIEWVSATGQVLYRIFNAAEGASFQIWNGMTFNSVGPHFPWPAESPLKMVSRLQVGGDGTFDLWIGTEISMVNYISLTGLGLSDTQISRMRWYGQAARVGGAFDGHYVGGVMIGNFDLRSVRAASQTCNANGFHNDGTGTYADVSSIPADSTTARTLTEIGQKFSMLKAARVLPGQLVIEKLGVNVAVKLAGIIGNCRPLLRIAGTDYPMGNVNPVPNAGYEHRGAFISISPASGATISQAEYNAAEVGIEARP